MPSEQRLHPLSLFFSIGSQMKAFILPALLVLFAARRSESLELVAAVIVVPYAAVAVFHYLTFRYRLDADEFVVRSGLWWRNERHIRYARVHNVEIVRNPLHRLLGVAEVRVETGGGDEPEAKLQVLALEDAERVRRHVFEVRDRAAAAPADATPGALPATEAAPARVLLHVPVSELVLLGLAENRGMLVVAAALSFIFSGNFYDVLGMEQWSFGRILGEMMERTVGVTGEWGRAVLLLVGLVAFVVLVPVRLLSIGWTLLQLYGFTLTRDGRGLRSRAGLLTSVEAAVPEHRIQLLTILEPPLLSRLGRVAVRVETAGGIQGAALTRQWLAPILPRASLAPLLHDVFADLDPGAFEWQPVDPRAPHRLFRRRLWVALLATAAAVYVWHAWGLVVLPPLLALSWFAAVRQARAMGFAVTPEFVASRQGWLWRSTSIARHARVQVVEMTASPFDRRWNTAAVAADTAGGGTHRIRMWPLDRETARTLRDTLAARAAATAFRW